MATPLFIPVIEASSGLTNNDLVYVGGATGTSPNVNVGKRKIIRVVSIGVATATDYIAIRFGQLATFSPSGATATDLPIPPGQIAYFDMGENDTFAIYSTSALPVFVNVISKN